MLYYKVVRQVDDRYCSAAVYERAEVTYKVGEWVGAPRWLSKVGFHCFVFRRLDDALRFHGVSRNRCIFACAVRGPRKAPPWVVRADSVSRGFLPEVCLSHFVPSPGGIMAREVMLLGDPLPMEGE